MTSFDEIGALQTDIDTVFDKVKLVREMMNGGMSLQEGLGDVLGFLEACHLDRLPDLIKSGSEGAFSEEIFARVLHLNDAIVTTLEAEKNGTFTRNITDGLLSLSSLTNENNSNEKASNTAVSASTGLTFSEQMVDVASIPLQGGGTKASPAPILAPQGKPIIKPPSNPTSPVSSQANLGIDLFDDSESPFHFKQQQSQISQSSNTGNDSNKEITNEVPPSPPQKGYSVKGKIDGEDFDSFLESLQK